MGARIQTLLGEAKGKMNGYVALLALRYGNLCVKADPISLLPVTVDVNGEEMNIESVAQVGIVQEDVLGVVPKKADFLYQIGKGVQEAHPEFKMDVVNPKDSNDSDDQYLTFTMPEVDKARHEVLTDGVKALHDQCQAKVDATYQYYATRVAVETADADPSIVDAVKDQLKELYDFYNDKLKQVTDQKNQEIDDAYQRYQQTKQEKEDSHQEQEQAHNEKAGSSMQMNEDE